MDAQAEESAVAVAPLGVRRIAGARAAVHGLVPAALTLGCGGGRNGCVGSSRLGTRRLGGRDHLRSSDCGCLSAAGAAGSVTGVVGFAHRPLDATPSLDLQGDRALLDHWIEHMDWVAD